MSKRELIDRIRLFNPTAGSDFLRQFDEMDLTQYLQHLVDTTPPCRLAAIRAGVRFAEAPPASGDPRQLALLF